MVNILGPSMKMITLMLYYIYVSVYTSFIIATSLNILYHEISNKF